jgi:hypothetical protein
MEDRDIFESYCTEKYVSNKTTNKSVTKVFVNNVFNLFDEESSRCRFLQQFISKSGDVKT